MVLHCMKVPPNPDGATTKVPPSDMKLNNLVWRVIARCHHGPQKKEAPNRQSEDLMAAIGKLTAKKLESGSTNLREMCHCVLTQEDIDLLPCLHVIPFNGKVMAPKIWIKKIQEQKSSLDNLKTTLGQKELKPQ